MDSLKQHELELRRRGDRADRVVAVGVFVAFLVTGFVVEDRAPRETGAAARAAQHAASVAAARR